MAKVFVGNLAFRTTETDLADTFKQYGTVVETKIVSRGRKSLGYGFVDFETAEQAQKAVHGMDQQELDGRPLNVELANPPKENNDQDDDYQDQNRGGGRGRMSFRGGYRGRGRGGYRGGGGGGGSSDRGGNGGGRGGGFRGGFSNYNSYGRGSGSNWRARGNGRGTRRGSFQRNRDDVDKTPSKSTLFIANLPFSVDDDSLKKIFEGFDVKSAHVVKTKSGKSRGYGFVTFGTEEDQVNAMKAVDNKEVTGDNGARVLSVKIALTGQEGDDESDDTPNNTNAPHSATTTTSDTKPTTATTTTTTSADHKTEAKVDAKEAPKETTKTDTK